MEPPEQHEVAAAVMRLRSHDAGTLGIVEPLARSLSRESFSQVLERLEQRLRSGTVGNDAGLLVRLLRVELGEQTRRQVRDRLAAEEATPAPVGLVERVKREDPERYLRAMAAVPGFDVDAYLREYVVDGHERARLRSIAA